MNERIRLLDDWEDGKGRERRIDGRGRGEEERIDGKGGGERKGREERKRGKEEYSIRQDIVIYV